MIAVCIRILLLLEPHFSNFEATLKILQRPSLFQTLNSQDIFNIDLQKLLESSWFNSHTYNPFKLWKFEGLKQNGLIPIKGDESVLLAEESIDTRRESLNIFGKLN